MSNLKYMINKLKTINYKELNDKIIEISKKTDKSKFSILFDMIKCCYKYGSGYTNYSDFEFYLLNDDERSTYVTDKYVLEIVNKYDNKDECSILDDRSQCYKTFNEFLGRCYIDLREVTFKDFKEFILDKDKILVRNVNSYDRFGFRVIDIDKTKIKNEYNILKIYNDIMKSEEFLVEEFTIQNKNITSWSNESFNEISVVSFLDDNKDVHIFSTVLRLNNELYTFINENGEVYVPAIDKNDNVYYKHPLSNNNIIGFKLPNYDKLEPYVKKLSLLIPDVRYICWNIIATNDGFVLIDVNTLPKVLQVKPSVSGIKTGDLVKYKKYMNI